MAKYEIVKYKKADGDVFIHLTFDGLHVENTTRYIKDEKHEKECIEELKNIIKNHKETGQFKIESIIYSED